MASFLLSVLPSVVALGLAAAVALRFASRRRVRQEGQELRRVASRALVLALGIQSVHFAEETATGFHERFPALLGLPGMPLSFFVVFNLAWIGIWVASVPGLRSSRPAAFFAAWFLAIAGMMNGIAHPLMAFAVGGYFPGLVTSPFIGGASVWLWRRLGAATQPIEA